MVAVGENRNLAEEALEALVLAKLGRAARLYFEDLDGHMALGLQVLCQLHSAPDTN